MKLLHNVVLVLIELAKRGGKARAREIEKAVGSGGNTYYVLQKLMLEGMVVKENGFYILTDKGWKALETIRNELLRIVNEIPVRV